MVSITEGVRNLRLGELIAKLHTSITEFSKNTSKMVELNESMHTEKINELRDAITKRLSKNENIEENQALLKTLDLFLTDKAFIRLIKEDSEEWLSFLDAIEEGLVKVDHNLTGEDKQEIDSVLRKLDEARSLIRKES